ncbi:MAG: ATP-binding protein [Bacteroidetes bacterium]|nr:ATP-binding protein [Bacteroidota bacterium]
MGAFVLVIAIGAAVDGFLVSRATRAQFSQYMSQNGLAWAQRLAPALVDYYDRNQSWDGVERILQEPWQADMMGTGSGIEGSEEDGWMMPGMMDRGGMDMDSMMAWGDMWQMMDLRLVLADVQGRVVADTLNGARGSTLSSRDLAAGIPLRSQQRFLGTLLPVSTTSAPTSGSGAFLNQLNASTWLSGLAAAVLALLLGSLLFRQIMAPVQALTGAAQRIAHGDFNQRIDVTSKDEIGQLARTYNQMADALAHDRQLRQTMIADIAHELRTPLSVIQGNLEAMLDGVLPSSPEEIASLRDESALLSRLVADLHLLSLAEAGQLKLEKVETDLGELARRVLASLRPQAESSQVELSSDIAEDLPRFMLDADRMSQVLHNLLSNALRHTPPGGTITLRVAHGGELWVEVTDTGSGIGPADLPHIFDRFFRADKSRSRATGGSGIGLAIVKQLVEAHGGRVLAESPAVRSPDGTGFGTRFLVSLPILAPKRT